MSEDSSRSQQHFSNSLPNSSTPALQPPTVTRRLTQENIRVFLKDLINDGSNFPVVGERWATYKNTVPKLVCRSLCPLVISSTGTEPCGFDLVFFVCLFYFVLLFLKCTSSFLFFFFFFLAVLVHFLEHLWDVVIVIIFILKMLEAVRSNSPRATRLESDQSRL
jgi:hypothetical protein